MTGLGRARRRRHAAERDPTPAPDPGAIGQLRVAANGDGVVLAAIAGDPQILSLWASSPVHEDDAVSWQRTAGELDDIPLAGQLDQEATSIDVEGWSPSLDDQMASADALEQVLVVTRPYDPSSATPNGMALWTWQRDVG